jgi:hypothetical protein
MQYAVDGEQHPASRILGLSLSAIVKRVGEYIAGAGMFSNKRLDI